MKDRPTSETPGDDTIVARKPRKRMRVLPDGDFALMVIGSDGELLPIPTLGSSTFPTEEKARQWLRENSTALMTQSPGGLKLALVAFRALMNLQFETKTLMNINERPRLNFNPETQSHE